MATWVLIAIFATIAVTALLVRILMAVNDQGRAKPGSDNGGDAGPVYVGDSGRRVDHDNDGGGDPGDGGGGDGGGGGD